MSLLRQGNVVVGGAGAISDTLAQTPRLAKINLDLTELDAACTEMSQAVDEFRVLGPAAVVEPAIDLLEAVLDARQSVVGGADLDGTKAASGRVFDEKQRLLAAAQSVDLLDGR